MFNQSDLASLCGKNIKFREVLLGKIEEMPNEIITFRLNRSSEELHENKLLKMNIQVCLLDYILNNLKFY